MPLALFTTLRELGFRWRNCGCTPHTQALPRLFFHQGFCLIKKQFTVGRTWPLAVSRKHHSWAPRVISLHTVHKIQEFCCNNDSFRPVAHRVGRTQLLFSPQLASKYQQNVRVREEGMSSEQRFYLSFLLFSELPISSSISRPLDLIKLSSLLMGSFPWKSVERSNVSLVMHFLLSAWIFYSEKGIYIV